MCCVLLFEIPGVSNAKAVRFLFCFYLQIRIAWHVRASSPAVPGSWSRLVIRTKVFFVTVRQTIVKHQKHRHSQGEMASTAEKTAHKRSVIAFNIDRQRDGRGRGGLTMTPGAQIEGTATYTCLWGNCELIYQAGRWS